MAYPNIKEANLYAPSKFIMNIIIILRLCLIPPLIGLLLFKDIQLFIVVYLTLAQFGFVFVHSMDKFIPNLGVASEPIKLLFFINLITNITITKNTLKELDKNIVKMRNKVNYKGFTIKKSVNNAENILNDSEYNKKLSKRNIIIESKEFKKEPNDYKISFIKEINEDIEIYKLKKLLTTGNISLQFNTVKLLNLENGSEYYQKLKKQKNSDDSLVLDIQIDSFNLNEENEDIISQLIEFYLDNIAYNSVDEMLEEVFNNEK